MSLTDPLGACTEITSRMSTPSEEDPSVFCLGFCANLAMAGIVGGHGSWPSYASVPILAECPSACRDSIREGYNYDAFPASFCRKALGLKYTSDWCDVGSGIDRDGKPGTVTLWPEGQESQKVTVPCDGHVQHVSFQAAGDVVKWQCSDSATVGSTRMSSKDVLHGSGAFPVELHQETKSRMGWLPGRKTCRLKWQFA